MNKKTDIDEDLIDEIIEAVEAGDVELAKKALLDSPTLISHDVDGGGWICVAAHLGDLGMVKMLTEIGCDVNHGHDVGTPLGAALLADAPDITEFLLACGAKISSRYRNVLTAVSPQRKNSIELLKILETHGADLDEVFLNEYTGENMNALSKAMSYEMDDVVEFLRSRGCILPWEKTE